MIKPGHESTSSNEGPTIPQRAPAHTKATHRALARKRSEQRLSPPNQIPSPASEDAAGSDPIDGHANAHHPFGKELEQVDEVAEEFGVRGSLLEEEERILREHGLQKFAVQEYIAEIEGLFGGVFEDRLIPMGPMWI